MKTQYTLFTINIKNNFKLYLILLLLTLLLNACGEQKNYNDNISTFTNSLENIEEIYLEMMNEISYISADNDLLWRCGLR